MGRRLWRFPNWFGLNSWLRFTGACARAGGRAEFQAAVRQFQQDDLGGLWIWLPLDSAILNAAAQTYTALPETVFLRSSDCVHLVTALHHNFPEICTYDKHQTLAAPALGLRPVTA